MKGAVKDHVGFAKSHIHLGNVSPETIPQYTAMSTQPSFFLNLRMADIFHVPLFKYLTTSGHSFRF